MDRSSFHKLCTYWLAYGMALGYHTGSIIERDFLGGVCPTVHLSTCLSVYLSSCALVHLSEQTERQNLLLPSVAFIATVNMLSEQNARFVHKCTCCTHFWDHVGSIFVIYRCPRAWTLIGVAGLREPAPMPRDISP